MGRLGGANDDIALIFATHHHGGGTRNIATATGRHFRAALPRKSPESPATIVFRRVPKLSETQLSPVLGC